MSVDSAWLIIAVIICRAFLQKAPKYFRKILWGLVGLRLLIPFSFESALSLMPHQVQQTTDTVVEQVVTEPVKQGLSFSEIVPFLWIAVGVALVAYGIISYLRLRLRIIDGILVTENIYCSEKIESPFVCGFIKPKIYLPCGLDEATQKCVLQHEKTHIKYADHIIKAIGFLVLCIHWFNPLVWVAYFMLCKDIELSCDESVVRNFDSDGCKQYAKALLDLGVNKVKFTACPVAFGEVSIKTRIKSVISYKKAGKALVAFSLCLCTVVALCFMTEPEVKAKEKLEAIIVPEAVTESATETITESVTEAVTESVVEQTEPAVESEKITETKPEKEALTKSGKEAVTEAVAEITTEPVAEAEIYIIKDSFVGFDNVGLGNSLATDEYDPMRDKASDAGVFANDAEKDALTAILEKNNQ